jgi:cyclophilin family peptidyl-prolyl cis-trans isomerase
MPLAALVLTLAQAVPPAAAPAPPPPAGPLVALEITQGRTPLGTITIALDKEKAPLTVENFLQYVRSGHYDGTVFHRVMPGFMIQGGGYTPEMEEKKTQPPIVNEARNGLHNTRGSVAMARVNDPNSATSQFFINVRDNYRLDFGISGAGYAVFGQVVDGLELADKISLASTSSRGPFENVPQVAIVIKHAHEVKAPPAKPAAPKPPAGASLPVPRPASHPAPKP